MPVKHRRIKIEVISEDLIMQKKKKKYLFIYIQIHSRYSTWNTIFINIRKTIRKTVWRSCTCACPQTRPVAVEIVNRGDASHQLHNRVIRKRYDFDLQERLTCASPSFDFKMVWTLPRARPVNPKVIPYGRHGRGTLKIAGIITIRFLWYLLI